MARPEMLFYDGHCGLCHRAVRFVARHDRGEAFHFAPLGGEAFTRLVPEPARAGLPDSLVVLTNSGELLVRSAGVLYLLRRLGGFWAVLAVAMAVVPRALRDGIYDAVARVRRKWFAAPIGVCPAVPPDLRARFLR